ncbi:MAG TPA: hypothetical protein VFP60_09685 [Pseudolabrys sp.]|nr:hypothetical protein [Pseudolabrys sp.]
MQRDTLFFLLYLLVIGALLIMQAPRSETKSATTEDKSPITAPEKAPTLDTSEDGHQQGNPRDEVAASQSAIAEPPVDQTASTQSCEKELRHTVDLLRFFANRIQMGEDTQSVLADMRQQEKKISEVCG